MSFISRLEDKRIKAVVPLCRWVIYIAEKYYRFCYSNTYIMSTVQFYFFDKCLEMMSCVSARETMFFFFSSFSQQNKTMLSMDIQQSRFLCVSIRMMERINMYATVKSSDIEQKLFFCLVHNALLIIYVIVSWVFKFLFSFLIIYIFQRKAKF